MPRKKSPEKTTDPEKPAVGELIPQPHGGALRYGGTNAGGSGRPASAIRERLRGSFEERINILEEIADTALHSASDRMKAIDLMGKYSLDDRKEIKEELVREKLRLTLAEIYALLPAEQAEALIDRIEPIWQ